MSRARPPWTHADIPDQRGRTAVVTGANAGLGYQTAVALAARGAHVVLAIRSLERGREALRHITATVPGAQLSLQQVDLASLASIRDGAAQLRYDYANIDLLINNAGVVLTPYSVTSDGFETQFGTNHLGHFALTGLILDRLLATPGSRVVTITSLSHRMRADIRFDDLHGQQRYRRFGAYSQAKLANLLFTYELQRRLSDLTHSTTIAVAAHPGVARTDLGRDRGALSRAIAPVLTKFLQAPEMGALPTLRAATDPSATGSQLFGPDGFAQLRGYPALTTSNRRAQDGELARRLWVVSEELTGVRYLSASDHR